MDNLVKNRLMTKPMVAPLEPVEVIIQAPSGNVDIKGIEIRDVRTKNANYDIAALREKLIQAKLGKVSVKQPLL